MTSRRSARRPYLLGGIDQPNLSLWLCERRVVSPATEFPPPLRSTQQVRAFALRLLEPIATPITPIASSSPGKPPARPADPAITYTIRSSSAERIAPPLCSQSIPLPRGRRSWAILPGYAIPAW